MALMMMNGEMTMMMMMIRERAREREQSREVVYKRRKKKKDQDDERRAGYDLLHDESRDNLFQPGRCPRKEESKQLESSRGTRRPETTRGRFFYFLRWCGGRARSGWVASVAGMSNDR
jgi:hypothetical protein